MARKEWATPEYVLKCFRKGCDTFMIAKLLNRSEALILNLLVRAKENERKNARTVTGVSPVRK